MIVKNYLYMKLICVIKMKSLIISNKKFNYKYTESSELSVTLVNGRFQR